MGKIKSMGAAVITASALLLSAPVAVATPASQASAVRSAQTYIEIQGFSRQGLINQLEYEGYSTADASAAVDSLGIDYNEQAARSAETYLEIQGFSYKGMVEQLAYEGYTASQAAYGASSVGL